MTSLIFSIKQKTNLSDQEIWWMLEAITKKPKETLVFLSTSDFSERELNTIKDWIDQINIKHIPLSYLLGWVPFLDLKIKVVPPILIPRPETEEWVAFLIKKLEPHKSSIKNILDIGTGSGCIALALAHHFPNTMITAVDINPQAIALVKENAAKNNIYNLHALVSDLFANIQHKTFDLIVSNPPYINPQDKSTISNTVLLWEDHDALFAPDNGMAIIKKIITQSLKHLKDHSCLPYQLIFEFDPGQEQELQRFCKEHGFNSIIHQDLFKKNRAMFCSRI